MKQIEESMGKLGFRVTVRKLRVSAHFVGSDKPDATTYVGTDVWTVWVDGVQDPRLAVVSGNDLPGMALIKSDGTRWRMVTPWHIGIGPGDFARRYVPQHVTGGNR